MLPRSRYPSVLTRKCYLPTFSVRLPSARSFGGRTRSDVLRTYVDLAVVALRTPSISKGATFFTVDVCQQASRSDLIL